MVLTGAEIDCNLNQIAQKIPFVSPSTRKILLENKEHVILPSGPGPTCSGPHGRQVRGPTDIFLWEKPPFQAGKCCSSILGWCVDTLAHSALWSKEAEVRERWTVRPVRGLEARAGGMGKKGSLEERAKGLLYLYKKGFQSRSPTGITCKALKIPQCPGSTLEQISQNLCGQGLCPQIFSKNSEMLMCRESWKPLLYHQLLKG